MISYHSIIRCKILKFNNGNFLFFSLLFMFYYWTANKGTVSFGLRFIFWDLLLVFVVFALRIE